MNISSFKQIALLSLIGLMLIPTQSLPISKPISIAVGATGIALGAYVGTKLYNNPKWREKFKKKINISDKAAKIVHAVTGGIAGYYVSSIGLNLLNFGINIKKTRIDEEEKINQRVEELLREWHENGSVTATQPLYENDIENKAWNRAYARWTDELDPTYGEHERSRHQQEQQRRQEQDKQREEERRRHREELNKQHEETMERLRREREERSERIKRMFEESQRRAEQARRQAEEEARKRREEQQKNMVNHYKTLGVARSASVDEIRAAYKKLARQYHPDKNPNGAEQFKKINEAHETLTDSIKRKDHDNALDGVVNECVIM